ncbi:DNA-binding response regulator (plasmid) [Aristophania vespae]|uniref:DNA-binding response regulator n=1 Tax=Aristophania vespae TaxID=2697033 RepID=A0A6P1NG12_9PROT|nr:response regulator transcription factor [Aristophania vespae]QHI96509.1 DNA-binding response regulator [Aristophania vespae]
MRLICIGDTQKNTDGRPCRALSMAISEGNILLRMSGREGILSMLRDFSSDIVIIQQTQPDPYLVRMIRANRFDIPIIIIARNLIAIDTAEVISAGADDCVSITIEPVELLARIKAVVRRGRGYGTTSQIITIGRLTVKEDTQEVLLDNDPILLTHAEYEVVSLMARRRGSLLNKSVILSALYADGNRPASKTIDVMVCRIRQKMRKRGIIEPFKTSWGMGYRLNENAFLPLGAREKDNLDVPNYVTKESSLPITGD